MLGLGLPDLLAARDARAAAPLPSFGRATRCIFLFMWGGPSQLETWDPKPDAPREVRGEFRPIATRIPGVRIGEHFPRLAARADRLCLVRSMTHDSGDHTKATSFLLTGEPPTPGDDRRAQWPNLGSTLSALGRSRGSLPPVVQMRPRVPGDVPRFVEQSQGQFAGWLGGAHDPFTIDDDPSAPGYRVPDMELSGELSVERLDDRMRLLGALDRRIAAGREGAGLVDDYRRRAFDLLDAAATEKGAFDLAREPDAVRDRYGRNPHGQSVLQARRLVERGVPLVTVFWPNDGIKNVSVYWDTHARNFIDHRDRLMPPADMAFATGHGRLTGEEKTRRPGVVGIVVRHRAHDTQPVGAPRQPWKVLADMDPGHGAGDRPELAAHLARGVGLEVPRLELRRPAPHEQEDAALRPPERGARTTAAGRLRRPGREQLRERDPEQAEAAEAH